MRITRAPKGSGGEWDAMYDDITQGWISFLAQLRFAVEEQPNAARRTVFLASGPGPAARALLDVADLAPGDDYAIAPVTGLELSGTAWFRTDGQTGLTVADYGPGLVVLADKPGAEPGSAESSMAIVSTFGLDDAAFAAVGRGLAALVGRHAPRLTETAEISAEPSRVPACIPIGGSVGSRP